MAQWHTVGILNNILSGIKKPSKTLAFADDQTSLAVRPRPRGGSANPLYNGAPDDMEFNSEVFSDNWIGSAGYPGIAQKMMSDPYVKATVNMVANCVINSTWDFEPTTKSDPAAVEIADFCRMNFFERLDFDKFVKQLVTGYHRDGSALFEFTDNVVPVEASRFPNHMGQGKGVVSTGLHYRPAWSIIKYHQSRKNPLHLAAVTQRVTGSDVEKPGERKIPADRILRWTYDQEDANFHGRSVLRSAYGPWKMKVALQVLAMIKAEKCSVPLPTIELPEDATTEDLEICQKILRDLRANQKGYAIFPNGYKFSYETVSTQSGVDLESLIEMCNKSIATNILAQFQLLGVSSNNGSFALAATQETQFHQSVESAARFIASVFNTWQDGHNILDRLVKMNFGPEAHAPKLVFRNLPTKDYVAVLPILYNLTQPSSGVITPDDALEDYVREVMSLPQRDPATARLRVGEEKNEEEEKEESQEQDSQEPSDEE
mgnify:CR=1 FL=1